MNRYNLLIALALMLAASIAFYAQLPLLAIALLTASLGLIIASIMASPLAHR